MESLITVGVPVYNVEKYLKFCLESLKRQTYKNIEVIIIDDGSTDNSALICKEYSEKDNRFKYYYQVNSGVATARNNIINYMNGDFLTFVDSDDYVSENYISNLYNAFLETRADLIVSKLVKVYRHGERDINLLCDTNIIRTESNNIENLRNLLYKKNIDNYPVAKLYRKSILKDLNYPVGRIYEDIKFTYKLIEKCSKITYLDNYDYYYYRKRNDSLTSLAFDKRQFDAFEFTIEQKEYLNKYSELSRATKYRCFNIASNTIMKITNSSDFNYKNILWKEMKKNRVSVLFDRNVLKTDRIKALVSLFGMHFYIKFFRLVKK